jgi:hypothetical protein
MTTRDGQVVGSFKLVDHGRDSRRLNLVFISEGYRLEDIPVFNAVVNQVVKEIRLTSPFQALWPNINVHQITVTSTDAGADIPAKRVTANTFFDATYGTGCAQRDLTVNNIAVITVVSQFINGDTARVVIVNSSEHGGHDDFGVITVASGVKGALSWAVMHELGHLIGGLDDEYDGETDCPGSQPQAQYAGPEPAAANSTMARDRAALKWADLVDAATNLPTLVVPAGQCLHPPAQVNPAPDGTVGLFEGASTFNCGLFRSEFNCRMRHRGNQYCEVCSRTLRARMAKWTPMPAELSRTAWTSGWDLICAIDIAGVPHMVSYKPASGSIAIDKVRADGSGTDPVLGSTWSTGWTSIVPLQLGGAPHLLLYKSASGRVEIDAVVNGGQDVNPVSSDTWTTGWTSIVPFTLGGKQLVFSYKAGSGSVAIDRVRDDASGTDPVLGATWATGWTHHAIWEQSWGATLVSYRATDGSLDVDRILDSGATTDTVISTKLPTGFSSLTRLDWHGEPVFLLHTKSTGVGRFEHIHDPGPPAQSSTNVPVLGPALGKIGDVAWKPGWQSLTPFALSGQPHWLAYNGSAAVIDRLD